MKYDKEVIISVAERFSTAFQDGKKTAEVRRRRLHVKPETRVWIYAKLPVGRVELVAQVEEVVTASPGFLWREYGERTALLRAEFFHYLNGVDTASVVLLHKIKQLLRQPTLVDLRKAKRGFQPPQFAKFVRVGGALHRALREG